MACMYCGRDDKFVKEEGKCILHTPKFSWYKEEGSKRVWDTSLVNSFWKVVREEVMIHSESHSFQYVIFPAFERSHTKTTSSSHSRHQMYEAEADFSFWKKGADISFEKMVDFSFASFIEPATFKNVFFKEADFVQVKASRISFNEATLQSINFKESKIEKMHFQNSNLEKVYFDRSQISWLMLNENFIDKLFITKSKIHSMFVQKIKEGRNIMVNDSQMFTLEVKELKNSRLNISNSKCENTHIENIVTDKLSMDNNELNNFVFDNNRITGFELKNSFLKSAFNIGTGKVSRFEIDNCSMGDEANLWFSDITIKELALKNIKNEIPLCSFEKIKIEKSFIMHNVKMNSYYAQDVDFSSSKLILSFINMSLYQSHASNVDWGVLKQERLDCDESSLLNLYKLYAQRNEMQQANLFHQVLHSPKHSDEQILDDSLSQEGVSLRDTMGLISEKVNLKQLRSDLKNIKKKVPSLKLEIKETQKDIFEVEIGTKTRALLEDDENAVILKHEVDFMPNFKEFLQNSCELLGCSRLKNLKNIAS